MKNLNTINPPIWMYHCKSYYIWKEGMTSSKKRRHGKEYFLVFQGAGKTFQIHLTSISFEKYGKVKIVSIMMGWMFSLLRN